MVRVWRTDGNAVTGRFAEPPWNEQEDEWLVLDGRVPLDHLARQIEQMVERLDLTSLIQSYGTRPEPMPSK